MQKAKRKEHAWCASGRARRWFDWGGIRRVAEDDVRDIREAARGLAHQRKYLELHSELDGKCVHYHLDVEVKTSRYFKQNVVYTE